MLRFSQLTTCFERRPKLEVKHDAILSREKKNHFYNKSFLKSQENPCEKVFCKVHILYLYVFVPNSFAACRLVLTFNVDVKFINRIQKFCKLKTFSCYYIYPVLILFTERSFKTIFSFGIHPFLNQYIKVHFFYSSSESVSAIRVHKNAFDSLNTLYQERT